MNAIKNQLLSKNRFTTIENKSNGWYIEIFKSIEKKNKRIGFGIGYDNETNTYYHNQVAGNDGNSVWNYSRESNELNIGWYRFTELEILSRIEKAY